MAEPTEPSSHIDPALDPEVETAIDPEVISAAARDADLDEGRMAFIEHLRELRTRLRNSILAMIFGFVVALTFSRELFVILAKPLLGVWADLAEKNPGLGERSFYFGSLIEPFWTYFSIAFWGGIFVASPIIFQQLWKFIAPGLYKTERRYGLIFGVCSSAFFISGAVFCYLLVLPAVCEFLLNYASSNLSEMSHGLGVDYQIADAVALQPLLSMQEYLSFAKKLLIGFGVIFELPLLIFFLSLAGVVTHRSLWKFNRYFVVVAFVVGAILTPPDFYSQLLMAAPLIVLYNISIGIAWVVTTRRERAQARVA